MQDKIGIRPATAEDRSELRRAVIELQDHERQLHATRLPGEQIADAYLDWISHQANASGVLLVAEHDGKFAGFVAGWIETTENIAETPESTRFGYVSDIYVMPVLRGRRIAIRLLGEVEHFFHRGGIQRLRINTLALNAAARTSYERAGFAPYEIIYEKLVNGGNAA